MAFTPFFIPRPSDFGMAGMGSLLAPHPYLPGLPLHPGHGLGSPLLPKLQNAMGRAGLTPGDFLPPPHGLGRPLGVRAMEVNDPDVQDDPHVELESKDLWQRFHKLQSEMVITKSGRSVMRAVFMVYVVMTVFRFLLLYFCCCCLFVCLFVCVCVGGGGCIHREGAGGWF